MALKNDQLRDKRVRCHIYLKIYSADRKVWRKTDGVCEHEKPVAIGPDRTDTV